MFEYQITIFARSHMYDCARKDFFKDPVITSEGHSYERTAITSHLKKSKTDPINRVRLINGELCCNLGLLAMNKDIMSRYEWIDLNDVAMDE